MLVTWPSWSCQPQISFRICCREHSWLTTSICYTFTSSGVIPRSCFPWDAPSQWLSMTAVLQPSHSCQIRDSVSSSSLRFYLFIFRERRRRKEKGRERNISVWLPLICPLLGTWPTTQACVLTENRTCAPLVHRPVLNPLSHTSKGPIRDSSKGKLPQGLTISLTETFSEICCCLMLILPNPTFPFSSCTAVWRVYPLSTTGVSPNNLLHI